MRACRVALNMVPMPPLMPPLSPRVALMPTIGAMPYASVR